MTARSITTHALSGTAFAERCATVRFDSWAGRTVAHVRVLGESKRPAEFIRYDGKAFAQFLSDSLDVGSLRMTTLRRAS